MPENDELLRTIESIRAGIVRIQEQRMVQLASTYADSMRQFQGDIELITAKIADGMTKSELRSLPEYKRLISGVYDALQEFGNFMTVDLRRQSTEFIRYGNRDAIRLLKTSAGDVGAIFRELPIEAIEQLARYVDPGQPLYNRIQLFAPENVDRITAMMNDLIGKGYNPVTIGRQINNAFGYGLTDAMRMMRTVQIYSYRDASQANYVANSDLVRGWVWYAKLDGLTCMSCVAQHGSFHKVDEKLNDHHNGRCVQIPVTILSPDPFLDANAGKSWFESLPEADQRKMMGGAKWDAWKAGKFEFSQLSTTKNNDVFGNMKTEASLKELVGE